MTESERIEDALLGAVGSPCARGCTTQSHAPGCTCTHECPPHDDHCRGCLPRQATTGRLCHTCAHAILDAIDTIPDKVTYLQTRADGKLSPIRVDTDPTRRTANNPSPSPAHDLADEVIHWAWQTAENIADADHYQGPPLVYDLAGIPEPVLTDLLAYIGRHMDTACRIIPTELYDEATEWERRLERSTGLMDRLQTRIPTPCPSCNLRTLIRDDGGLEGDGTPRGDTVTCRNKACQRIWKGDEYDWLVRIAAEAS